MFALKQNVVSEFLLLVCLHFHIPSYFIFFSRPLASNLSCSQSFTWVLSRCGEQSTNRLWGGGKCLWNRIKYQCFNDFLWASLFVRSKNSENWSLNFVICVFFFPIIKFYVMPVHSTLPVLPDLSTYLETISLTVIFCSPQLSTHEGTSQARQKSFCCICLCILLISPLLPSCMHQSKVSIYRICLYCLLYFSVAVA